MDQIQRLSEKLHASRQQLDKLNSSAQATKLKEFQVREQSYKQIIQEMKEQLSKNSGDAVVPADVYHKALAEAQQLAVECQSYREDATTLAGRVAKLEKLLKQGRSQNTAVVPPPPPLPRPQRARSARRRSRLPVVLWPVKCAGAASAQRNSR